MGFKEKLVEVLSMMIYGFCEMGTKISEYAASFFKSAKTMTKMLISPLAFCIGILLRILPLFSEEALEKASHRNKIIADIVKTF